jgi:hypothetical protein
MLSVVHLPALNTPQFDWVKSRLCRRAQPVPPIFQPEIAAEAIVWTVDHPRREVWVGGSTYKSILAQRLIPGVLDLYLGKTGYNAQQYDGPANPNRADNLWQPVAGDAGAHGSFDDRAHHRSWTLNLIRYRKWLFGAGMILAGIAIGFLERWQRVRGRPNSVR